MRKNKSWFYVFATMAILVITGFIFITRERQIPPPADKSEIPEISIAKQTPIPQTPTPDPGEPGKEEVILSQKAPDQGSGLTISGRVTLSDGSPASEAKITLTKIETGESFFDEKPLSGTTADKNGKYSISIANLPIVFIKASYPGYSNLTAFTGSATYRPGGAPSGGKQEVTKDFTLIPASYIKGRVLNEKDQPIQGVSVTSTLRDEKMETFSIEKTTTDNQGRFDIQNIPPGKITISAGSLDYSPQSQDVTAPADDLVLKLLPATASLSGRVFLKTTGEPVTSATVRLVFINQRQITNLPQKTSVTDRTGLFSFDRLASGKYIINAQKDDLLMLTNDDLPNNRLELKENEKKEGLNLYLYEGHTIKGRVTDKNTGAPLEGVKVSSAWGAIKPLEDITGPDGFYMLKGLSGARAGLTAEKENYLLAREEQYGLYIRVAFNPDVLELTKDLQMIPGLFITGRVETDQGLPATNAHVYLYQRTDWTTRNMAYPVDQLGMFKLVVQPFTSCFVKAAAEGFPMAFSDPIDVQDKSIENIVVVMKQAASISGSVQDEDNNPLEGAKIHVRINLVYGNITSHENFFQNMDIRSDHKGQFKVENLPSEKIIIYAEKDDYAPSKQETIPLNPGEEKTDVTLQLTKPSFLAGKITDPEGNPLENVQIYVNTNISGVRSHGNAKTDADGRYRVEGLYNAPHNVNLSHTEWGGEFHRNVEVGREDADFVMGKNNKNTLIGNVKDWKTGNPVENFNVSGSGMKPEKDPEVPGRFTIKNLNPQMSYRLKIESEGYLTLDTGYFSLPKNENTVERTYELGPGGSIKGRVVNKATKEPMEGVGVQLYTTNNEWEIPRNAPAKTLTTRKDGLFNFETIPAGGNFIRFIPMQPLSPKMKNITVKHGETSNMGDVEMSGGGGIRGKLVQMPDEIPMPGKTITLQSSGLGKPPAQNAITDEQGRFEFSGVMSGRYFIQANEYNISEFAEVMEDEANEYILRIGTGVLKGVVMKKGEPQNVYVNLNQTHLGMGKSAQTDSKGAFEISGLVPGKWKVSFHMSGYSSSFQELIDIVPDKVTEKIFELPSGRIVGKVVNTIDEPVEGAQISAQLMQVADAEDAYSPKTWSAASDKDGAFAIADLLSTSYAVSASKKDLGLVLVENVVVPENADSAPVLLRLEEGKGGTLVSVAINLTNANPVPEAWCYLTTAEGVRFDHGKQRGQDGIVTIPNIPAGTYQVQVSSFGFSVHEHMVEIKDGEKVELEDVMYEAGALRWTVLDAEGNPIANALCRIEPIEANSIEKAREGTTDVQGLWIQRGLYPGGYRMTVRLDDGRQATDAIEIQAHQLIQKNVVVK